MVKINIIHRSPFLALHRHAPHHRHVTSISGSIPAGEFEVSSQHWLAGLKWLFLPLPLPTEELLNSAFHQLGTSCLVCMVILHERWQICSKLDNSMSLSWTHKSSGWVPGNLGKLAFHLQAPEPIGLHKLLSLIVDDLVQLKTTQSGRTKKKCRVGTGKNALLLRAFVYPPEGPEGS